MLQSHLGLQGQVCDCRKLQQAALCARAGGIEEGAITLDPCMKYVDTWVTVSEDEIANAMKSLLHNEGKLVEGAAACAVAACRQLADQLCGKKVVVVCCGGNVALQDLEYVLKHGLMQ